MNAGTETVNLQYVPGQTGIRDIRRAIEKAGFLIPKQEEGRSSLEIEKEAREQELSALRTKLIGSAVLSALVLLGSFQDMSHRGNIPRRTIWFVLFFLTAPVQFWAGRQFYQNAWASLRHGSTNMNTLVVVGTSAAFGYSAALTFFPSIFPQHGSHAGAYYDTSAVIITLILFGKYLEVRAKTRAGEAIKKLMGLQPRTARVIRDGTELDIPIEDVESGDLSSCGPEKRCR